MTAEWDSSKNRSRDCRAACALSCCRRPEGKRAEQNRTRFRPIWTSANLASGRLDGPGGVFTALVADLRPRLPRLRVKNFELETARQWQEEWARAPALPGHIKEQIDAAVQRAYAWADGLAVYYANGYRSASVLSYGLGLLATMLAVAIDSSPWIGGHDLLVRLLRIGAFISVFLILVIWFAAHRRHWHDRWIDYRLLAELLRQMRFLTLLGRPPAFSTPPSERSGASSRDSWPSWYLRAIARQAGLLDARLSPSTLEATRVLIKESLVATEARYHSNNARRLGRMDDCLRGAGSVFFVVALVALGVLVVRENSWITGVAALLPVFGGASLLFAVTPSSLGW